MWPGGGGRWTRGCLTGGSRKGNWKEGDDMVSDLAGAGNRTWLRGPPRAPTFRWGWPWGLGRQQHVGVRVPGVLASEKVAVVTRIATGPPGWTGVLHAVDAEHWPGGRRARPSRISPPHVGGLAPSYPHPYSSPTPHGLLATAER